MLFILCHIFIIFGIYIIFLISEAHDGMMEMRRDMN